MRLTRVILRSLGFAEKHNGHFQMIDKKYTFHLYEKSQGSFEFSLDDNEVSHTVSHVEELFSFIADDSFNSEKELLKKNFVIGLTIKIFDYGLSYMV